MRYVSVKPPAIRLWRHTAPMEECRELCKQQAVENLCAHHHSAIGIQAVPYNKKVWTSFPLWRNPAKDLIAYSGVPSAFFIWQE